MAWNNTSSPFRLVLAGGGHTNTQVVKLITRSNTPQHIQLILVSDFPTSLYSGMCPGGAAGMYQEAEFSVDLAITCDAFGWEFINETIIEFDGDNSLLHTKQGSTIPYDLLIIDIGSTNVGLDLPGIRENAISTRPLKLLMDKINETETRLLDEHKTDNNRVFDVVTVGGGCAGCELTMGLQNRMNNHGVNIRSHIITNAPSILSNDPVGLRDGVIAVTEQKNIIKITNCNVTEALPNFVTLDNDTQVHYDVLLWATGPAAIPMVSNIERNNRGFYVVDNYLRSVSHPNVFGAGDCITFRDFEPNFPPKAGVYAVREGPVLIDNILAYLKGDMESFREFVPQTDFLRLLNTGDGSAVGSKFDVTFKGAWVWKLKDWIDVSWMDKFDPEKINNPDSVDFAPVVEGGDNLELTPQGSANALLLIDTPDNYTSFATQWRSIVKMSNDEQFCNQVLECIHRRP